MPSPDDNLHPQEGARFLLLRRDDQAPSCERASYKGSVLTPKERYDYDVELHSDGRVALRPNGGVPEPPALEEMLKTIATLVARSQPRRRRDGLPDWPARVLRWRGPGR